MPNWCENRLSVAGDPESVARFREHAKGEETDLSLERVYPTPDVAEQHDWRIEHWGTKWDVEAELVVETDQNLAYRFDSAWTPPVAWLREASRIYPELRFHLQYEEAGIGFMGVARAHEGQVEDTQINT